jgi:hypothetical protein
VSRPNWGRELAARRKPADEHYKTLLFRAEAGHEDLAAFLDRVRPDVRAIELFLRSCGILVRNPGEKLLPLILRRVLSARCLACNSSHLLPVVDDVIDWHELHEDESRWMHARGLEALTRLVEAHRKIIDRRVETGRRGDHLPVVDVVIDWFGLPEDDSRRVHERAAEALGQVEAHREIIRRRRVRVRNQKLARKHEPLFRRLEDTHEVLTVFVEDYPRVMAWIRDVLFLLPMPTHLHF